MNYFLNSFFPTTSPRPRVLLFSREQKHLLSVLFWLLLCLLAKVLCDARLEMFVWDLRWSPYLTVVTPTPCAVVLCGLESLDLQVEGVIPFPINSKTLFSSSSLFSLSSLSLFPHSFIFFLPFFFSFFSLSFFSLLFACITINAAQYPKMTVMASFVADGH